MTLLRRYALKKRIYVKAEHGLMGILAAAVSRTPICFVLFMLRCFWHWSRSTCSHSQVFCVQFCSNFWS